MLEKRISAGHIYAKLSQLTQWEKNPRDIYDGDAQNLRILIATLGIFKPFFVTADGIMVGGNQRLPQTKWLNENLLEFTDDLGNTVSIDKRGKFDEVKITELDFAEIEGQPGKYKALLDGEIQEKVFDSIEQAMIEYAVADNQPAGFYDQQKLHTLLLPHKETINLNAMQLQLSPPVKGNTFMEQFKPTPPPLANGKEKGKSKEINLIIKFTPEQFSEVEPRIEELKAKLELENLTDVFMNLLDMADEQEAKEMAEGEEHVSA